MNIVEMMDNFAVNVEQERIRLGYTQTDFARKLGISLSTYKNIISHRESNINVEIIPKLYEITGMFVSEFFGCQNRELELLRSYRQLSERQKAYIDALIEYEIALKGSVDETDDYLEVIVPTGNMEDGMILDSAYAERVACPKFMAKYGTEVRCGIRITSNHLHPVYVKGDVIGIIRRPPRDGDTVIIINCDARQAYCRIYNPGSPNRFIPVNGYGETFEIDSDSREDMSHWVLFGIVASVIR